MTAAAVPAKEFVVAPDALTPQQALLAARAQRQADPKTPVTVRVARGVHPLLETLVFTADDSGVTWYGDDTAVLNGGITVTGWTEDAPGIVSAPIPHEVLKDLPSFNQLWVNGRRASNSLWPKDRFLSADGYTQFAVTNAEKQVVQYKQVPLKDADRAALASVPVEDLSHTRLLMRVKWSCSRHYLDRLDLDKGYVRVQTKKLFPPWSMPGKTSRLSFENHPLGFTAPGDWFCDVKAGRIRYRLRPGEQTDCLVVVAPRPGLAQLVRFDGKVGERPVANLVFSNLTFAVTAAQAETAGYQAAVNTDAAIRGTHLKDTTFVGCHVTQTGGYAFRLEDGCTGNRIVNCQLDDLGAGGLWIGAKDGNLPANVGVKRAVLKNDSPKACKFNRIDDCMIEHGGRVNTEGVGVVLGHASDCTVTHCEIADFEYTGVSVGWTWGYAGSIAQRNEISFNRIHDLGKGLMDDLAGVYTLGTSFGTSVSNNVIYNVSCSPQGYGGWGLYYDEGSEGIMMENNVVWNTTDGSFHQHYGSGCQVRNNILAYNAKGGCVRASNPDPFQHVPSQVCLYGNIILVKGAGNPLVDSRSFTTKGPWACNLWWNEDAEPIFCADGMKFDEWQRRGLEVGGVVADPHFVDAPNHDFRLQPDSPALKMGFREWDVTRSGRRRD